MPTTLAKIKSLLLFTGLDDQQLKQVLHAGIQRNIPADTYLYIQGDEAETFLLLVQGRVKLSQVTMEGHQVILRYAAPGESFGVVAALRSLDRPGAHPPGSGRYDRYNAVYRQPHAQPIGIKGVDQERARTGDHSLSTQPGHHRLWRRDLRLATTPLPGRPPASGLAR